MAYNIKRYDGLTAVTTVKDGDIDNSTLSINLIGKNRSGYGEAQNQNFVYLLENFAGANPPSNALSGQIWYDSTNKRLKYHDANSQTSYRSVARLETSELPPSVSSIGDLWFGPTTKQLKAWDGTEYVLIGPNTTDPSTTMQLLRVEDSSGSFHNVLAAKVLNQYIYIISSDPFVVAGRDPIASQGFTVIYEGITLRNVNSTGRSVSDYKYWGTASDADNLGGISAEKHVKFNDAGVAVLNNEGFTIGSDELKASVTSGVSKIIGKTEFYLNAGNTDVIKIASGAILRGSGNITIGSNQTPFTNLYADSANFTGNAYIRIPVGTTANRPVSPIVMNGQIRYNSDSNVYEGYSQGSWVTFSGGGGTGNYHPLNGGGPGSTYYLNASYISLTNNATTDSAPDGSIRYNGGQLQGKLSGSWVNLSGGGGTITTPVSISNGGTNTASPDLTFKLNNNVVVDGLEYAPYALQISGSADSQEVGLVFRNTFGNPSTTVNGFIGAGQSAMAIASSNITLGVSNGGIVRFFDTAGLGSTNYFFDISRRGIHGYFAESNPETQEYIVLNTGNFSYLSRPEVRGMLVSGPSYTVNVDGDIRHSGYGIILRNESNNNVGFIGAFEEGFGVCGAFVTANVPSTGAFKVFIQDIDSFRVDNYGIYSRSSIIQSFSDVRLKEITGNILDPLDKINSLNGFYFNLNELAISHNFINNGQQVGISAQDVQKVLPEAVFLAPFDRNDDGTSKSGDEYLTVQYEKLIPLLVEGIKEQTKLIESLTSRIEQLEAIIKQ